jgi:hypothetical protein
MRGNYGVCLLQDTEVRFANIVQFDIAVRSGPRHVRGLVADVIYSGNTAITLYAKPDNVLSTTLSITTGGLTLNGVALFALRGSIKLLGREQAVNLKQGERFQLSEPFTEH